MNKKIVKIIANVTCGLGIATAVPMMATSCNDVKAPSLSGKTLNMTTDFVKISEKSRGIVQNYLSETDNMYQDSLSDFFRVFPHGQTQEGYKIEAHIIFGDPSYSSSGIISKPVDISTFWNNGNVEDIIEQTNAFMLSWFLTVTSTDAAKFLFLEDGTLHMLGRYTFIKNAPTKKYFDGFWIEQQNGLYAFMGAGYINAFAPGGFFVYDSSAKRYFLLNTYYLPFTIYIDELVPDEDEPTETIAVPISELRVAPDVYFDIE